MKIVKWLDEHVEEVFLVTMLVLMTVVMVLQIMMRYVFGTSLSWAEEVTRYMFVWSGFISISYTLKNQTAMRLTVAVAAMPRKIRHYTLLFQYMLMLVFFSFMSYVAVIQMGSMRQVSAALEIPMNFVYVSTVIGFVLTSVRCIQALVFILKNFNKKHDLDIEQ